MCYIFSMFLLRRAKNYCRLKQKGITQIYKSRIFEFKTSDRYICAAHPAATKRIDFVVGNLELDSHTDTAVAEKDCTVLAYTDQKLNVAPYYDQYEPVMGVSIVYAATGYTTADRRIVILVLNEALHMPNIPHSLINQNQLRHFGTVIQDNPYSSDPMTLISPENHFIACLESTGTVIHLTTCSPMSEDRKKLPHVHLTSQQPWDHQNVLFPGIFQSEQ